MAELRTDSPNFGFGFMRLPRLEDGKTIDIEQVKQMVDVFMKSGFVYFDTAWGYPGSEEALRQSLVERYPRDSFLIATKLSMFGGELTREEAEARIDTSLQRLGTDHVDYYLLHNVSGDLKQTCEDYELWDYVKKLKADGKVRHYGFSCHDTPENLDMLLTKHPDVEFVQLQINYFDWNNPEVRSREMYEVARKHNKPIIVMEPVKGGVLANSLPESAQKVLAEANPDASYASWALRYVASLPGIRVILSGMSTLEQVEDNVTFMANIVPLSDAEKAVVEKAREAIASVELIGCTACEYCMKGCPMGIPTPRIINALNQYAQFPDIGGAKRRYGQATGRSGVKASDCIKCGICEDACPQHLPIRDLLDRASELFE